MIFLKLLALWLVACGGQSGGGAGNQGGATPPPEEEEDPSPYHGEKIYDELEFWIFDQGSEFSSAHGDDAHLNTFGVMKLEVEAAIDGYKAPAEAVRDHMEMKARRAVYLRKEGGGAFDSALLSQADTALLRSLCKDLAVSATGDFDNLESVVKETTLGTGEIHLAWRSHHPSDQVDQLAAILLTHGIEVKCGLDVHFLYDKVETSYPLVILFDPVPVRVDGEHPLNFYRGTTSERIYDAIRDGNMLFVKRPQKGEYPDADYARIPVTEDPAFTRGIMAINPDGFVLASKTDGQNGTCRYRLTSALHSENGSEPQKLSVDVDRGDEADFSITDISLTAAPGTGMDPSCNAMGLSLIEDSSKAAGFAGVFTCEEYRLMKERGGCAVAITVENDQDPMDRVVLLHVMDDLETETLDLTSTVNAMAIIPEAVGNPIRNETFNMIDFSSTQLAAIANAFDLWLAAAPGTYEDKFEPTVASITYKGSDCPEGAGAYATLGPGANDIYWCLAGAMDEASLEEDISPSKQVYRLRVALHESLHNLGANHDWEDEEYRLQGGSWDEIPPCADIEGEHAVGGTAYSAKVSVDIFNCEEDYCYAYRDVAKAQFKSELDYSLKNDSRRFLGQCATWATQLGVVFE